MAGFSEEQQAILREAFHTATVKSVQDGLYREIRPTTFKDYAEKWLEDLGDLKPSTGAAYASMVKHQLIPAFGERPLLGTFFSQTSKERLKRHQ